MYPTTGSAKQTVSATPCTSRVRQSRAAAST